MCLTKKGIGGNDIYVAHKKESGLWGKAINLGPLINTPFISNSKIYDDSILFSNGFPGHGKLDVFKCKIINDSVFDVRHLHYPVNSPETTTISLHPFDESIAILNSNRSKGKGDNDIYFAHLIPIDPYVKGYTKYYKDSTSQKNTLVRLLDNDNVEVSQFLTGFPGKYRFSLKEGQTYKLVATKNNYFGDTLVVSDETLFRNERKDIELHPDKTIQGYTLLSHNNEKIPNVKIDISNGIRSKKLTIYSDANGYFQFAFNKDSILLLDGHNEYLYGSKEFFIDSLFFGQKASPI